MLLVLTWGCRPSEASYIVHASSIGPGAPYSAHFDAALAATCPTSYTKTQLPYKWPVREEMGWAVELLRDLHKRVPRLKKLLGNPKTKGTTDLRDFYRDHVIPEAAAEHDEVTVYADADKSEIYNMRTIRAYHGTKLCREYMRCKRLNRPKPFNYLQHTSWKTTMSCYWDKREAAQTPDASPAGTTAQRRETKLQDKREAAITRHCPTEASPRQKNRGK